MILAKRLQSFGAYLGTAMNLIFTRLKEEGTDIINMGLGDPNVIPPEDQNRILYDACMNEDHRHYPSFYSPMPLKEAISKWYESQFGVTCDPETEYWPCWVLPGACFISITCLLDTEHVALVPDPCYPAYLAGIKVVGGVIELVPLLSENGFLQELFNVIETKTAHWAQIIWMYPKNRGPP